jgi:transposase
MDIVEKHFNTVNKMLKANILYLRDDYSVFGYILVAFLSLYGYRKIENMLRERILLNKISSLDVLERFSALYIIKDENRKIITEALKKGREINEKSGRNIFTKKSELR